MQCQQSFGRGLGGVFALAFLLAIVLAAPAQANTVSFAAGEQFTEPNPADFSWRPDQYWSDKRDTRAYTPALWRLLKRHGATVTVHLRYGRDFGPVPPGRPRNADALPIMRAAAKYRVPVNAWLVVPFEDGYWGHDGNAELTARAVRSYFIWAERRKVRAGGVLIDLEASIQDTKTISHLRDDPVAVGLLLRRNVAPSRQCDAARTYARIARDIQRRGVRALAAVYAFQLDDLQNGDLALSDGLNMPFAVPGEFDELGFMSMRSVYQSLTGVDPGPTLQSSYARDIDRWFPREGAFSLGVPGTPPYDELENLIDDIRMVATVSKHPVGLYSLETTFGAFGLKGVEAVLEAAKQPLPDGAPASDSPGTLAARGAIASMDAMVGTGTPLAGPTRGEPPEQPNTWPPACGMLSG